MDRAKRLALLLATGYLIRYVTRAHLKFHDANETGEPRAQEGARVLDDLRCVTARDEALLTGTKNEAVAKRASHRSNWTATWRKHKEPLFPLETERLIIRPFVLEDAREAHKVYADPDSIHSVPGKPSTSGSTEFCQLNRSHWCKGYAKEATAECLGFGLERLSLKRIVAVMNPDDPPSAQMLGVTERSG